METKTERVKAVKPCGKQDNYGNYSYIVDFENGDSGFFKTKTDQVGSIGLIVGQEFEYTIEKKTSGAGKEYFVIGKPKKEKPAFSSQKDPATQKMIVAQNSMTNAVNYGVAHGLDTEDIYKVANDMFNWVMKKGE